MNASVSYATQNEAGQAEASSVRFVDEVAELAAIFEPQVSIAVLQRARPEALIAECERAVAQPGFARRFSVAASRDAEREISAEFGGFPELAADIVSWVELLGEVTGVERVGVRLARMEAAMCPRLHVDRVTLRLVCTYFGRGTEFVAGERFDRGQLGHAAQHGSRSPSSSLHAHDDVLAAQAGDIVLLKGEGWPGNAGRGAIHRSPSASPSAPRLVMTLDPL